MPENIHIVFIAPRYHTNQYFWVKSLQEAGFRISFWTATSKGSEDHSLIMPEVVQKDDRESWKVSHFEALLNRDRVDAVVIRNPVQPFGKAAAAAVRARRIPIVLYSQGPLLRREPWIRRTVVRMFQRRLGNAPWITPVRGHEGSSRKRTRNWHYLPFVMEPGHQVDPAGRRWCPGGVCRLIMVGKYMERKNHLLLIQALEMLVGSHRFTLDIYGSGTGDSYDRTRNRVRAYIDERGLDWVTMKGAVPYAELQQKMHDYDIFILPSRNEAVGVSLLEAMGKGLPVVCSTTAGAQDYVEHGVNGFVFESDNGADLSKKMQCLLQDPAILKDMGVKSLELIRTRHSPQKFLKQFIPLLRLEKRQ